MDEMLDGSSAAELARDKDEMPESILVQARKELVEKGFDGLTFDSVLDALAAINEIEKEVFLKATKFRKPSTDEIMAFIVHVSVDRHITPTEDAVSLRAAEILAEMDDRKGVTI